MRALNRLPLGLPVDDQVGVTPVQGTWSWVNDPRSVTHKAISPFLPELWWQRGSLFMQELEKHELVIYDPQNPYAWDTGLDGWLTFIFNLRRWRASGWALFQHARHIPFLHRNFITYSHGFQPLLFALGYGLQARNIVAVSPPIRGDVIKDVAPTSLQFDSLTVITEKGLGDIMRDLGQLLSGRVDDHAPQWNNCRTIEVEGMGHGSVLHDPNWIRLWTTEGWWALLKNEQV